MSSKSKTARESVRVLIVDDHPTVREGLSHRVNAQHDMSVCGEAADVADALQQIKVCQPDVVIVDIALKESDGLELIKAIKARHKQVRALVHSMYDEAVYAQRCLSAGALGYVNKEAAADDVIQAIRNVYQGRVHVSERVASEILGRAAGGAPSGEDPISTLTDRQLEIFRLIGQGKSAAHIAGQLHISVHTVETHRENIKRKLKVETVSELTRLAALWEADKR